MTPQLCSLGGYELREEEPLSVRAWCLTGVALLAVAGAAHGEPTAWACSTDTLRTSASCLFEAVPPRAADGQRQARENVKQARALVQRLCLAELSRAAQPVLASLIQGCKDAAAEVAPACALSDGVPLQDAAGRFPPEARDCYEALGDVLARTRVGASVGNTCCQCLEARGCPGAGPACTARVAQQQPDAEVAACMQQRCSSACGDLAPPAAAPPPSSTPPPPYTQPAGSALQRDLHRI